VLALGLTFWIVPWLALSALGDDAGLFRQQYLFFTQAALVTFGGAYAVLSYVTHAVVEQFHWLTRPEVIDGLALAETTPGPLIIVLECVGFLAGWNDPGVLSRGLSGTLGASVTTYATFLPSLTLVFLGAPYVARVQSLPRLGGALRAISAAVTGVIASLGLDYGIAVLVPHGPSASPDVFALATIIASALTLRRGASLGTGVAMGFLHLVIS
jgi:chromate transporter